MKILSANPRFSFETVDGSENEQAIIREVFAENVYRVSPEDLSDTGQVVDLGANIGAFAVFCVSLREDVDVYAYEPEPHNFELLMQNAASDRVRCHPRAVGGSRGTGHITNERGGSRLSDEGSEVEIITLEDVWDENELGRVDVLKLDVEGSETEILTSAPSDLLERIAYITLEYDQHGKRFGKLVEKLSETHAVQTLGSHKRGAYIFARRYE